MALWHDYQHPLMRVLGRPARTPEFIDMVDNINNVEKTPREKLLAEMSRLDKIDWLMGRHSLLRHIRFQKRT